ncbi:hypothetical protein LBMAG21_08690 [Armatimonadota bacterium]|nr:hypothetical protein LBMAG21_08690 [Armatimonadota bacterium]
MPERTRQERLSAKYFRTAYRRKGREDRLERESIEELIELTFHPDAEVRKCSANQLCPCHVQSDYPEIWNRLIAMANDPDVKVRGVILHTLLDGSPREREEEIVATLEKMYHDPDIKLRRRVRQLLANYRRGGKLNVL